MIHWYDAEKVAEFWSVLITCACLVAQSYPTLCDSVDTGPPGPSVHGPLQARILE